MNCIKCDGRLTRGPVTLSGDFRGESFTVEMEGVHCLACRYSTIHGRDSSEFSRRLADAYRQRHGLLTSDEIKAARSRVRKSQSEFADYLKVGVASVKRWEAGQVQDAAMDELIRLKTDLAAAVHNVSVVRDAVAIEAPLAANIPHTREGSGFTGFTYFADLAFGERVELAGLPDLRPTDFVWVHPSETDTLPVRARMKQESGRVSRKELAA